MARLRVVLMDSTPDSLPTRSSFLLRLRNTDDQASWQQFYDLYRPLIFAFARKAGLSEADADEVAQETLIAMARHLPGFQHRKRACSFKTWLLNAAHWRVKDQFRKSHSQRLATLSTDGDPSTGSVEQMACPIAPELEALWDKEWQAALLQAGLAAAKAQVKPEQWQIFDLYVVKDWTAGEVARARGINIGQVYLAKTRVSHVVKRAIDKLERGQATR